MKPLPAGFRSALGLAFVAWMGIVLWRYQEVQSPEPMAGVVLVACWLAVFTLACLGGGRWVWQMACGRSPLDAASSLVAMASGAGVLMGAAALLGVLGWLRTLPLAAVLLLLASLGVPAVGPLVTAWRPARPIPWLPASLIALAVLATALVVPTPSPFYDQLHYHLAFPFHWLRAGRLLTFPREAYSFLPADMGLLYAYCLALLGPVAAQAVHAWMGALAAAAAGLLGARLGGRDAGWWAAAVFALTPAVLACATWAAADLGVAAFAAAAWLTVTWTEEHAEAVDRTGRWILAGGLVGVAAGCKVLAIATVAIPVALAVALARLGAGVRLRLRAALLLTGGAVVAFGPWMVRDAILTGDPVYPFLARSTTSDGSTAATGEAPRVASGIAGLAAGFREPARLASLGTFRPEGEGGAVGPVYLALVPLAVWFGIRRREARALLFAAALSVLGWGVGPPVGRYLLPALAFLAVLAASGWTALRGIWPTLAVRLGDALLAAALCWGALAGTSQVELARLGCTLGRGSVDALMREWVSDWPAVQFVNRELPRNATLLLVAESRSMYVDRDVVVEDPFRTPLLVELANRTGSAAGIAARLRELGVTHVLVNEQEARRIAALDGRPAYFSQLSAAGGPALARFMSSCLRRLWSQGPVAVYALEECR